MPKQPRKRRSRSVFREPRWKSPETSGPWCEWVVISSTRGITINRINSEGNWLYGFIYRNPEEGWVAELSYVDRKDESLTLWCGKSFQSDTEARQHLIGELVRRIRAEPNFV